MDANLDEFEGNRNNALRAALKTAIERLRPEGERKYTSDWILYNILDLKFIQGEKVREVARRLSISEADLYRNSGSRWKTSRKSLSRWKLNTLPYPKLKIKLKDKIRFLA